MLKRGTSVTHTLGQRRKEGKGILGASASTRSVLEKEKRLNVKRKATAYLLGERRRI